MDSLQRLPLPVQMPFLQVRLDCPNAAIHRHAFTSVANSSRSDFCAHTLIQQMKAAQPAVLACGCLFMKSASPGSAQLQLGVGASMWPSECTELGMRLNKSCLLLEHKVEVVCGHLHLYPQHSPICVQWHWSSC